MGENKDKITKDFDSDIQEKRQESFNQFKTRWESIMNRYSKPILNDDVIDLFTGEIIEDHGFIKSIKPLPFGSMVNSMEDGEDEENSSHSQLNENKEENFTYDEDDFDNLLTPKKQTLLQIISKRMSRKKNKLDKDTTKNTNDTDSAQDSITKDTNDIEDNTNSNILSPTLENEFSNQEVFDSIMEMGFSTNNELSYNEEIEDELDLFSDIGIPSVDFDNYNDDNDSVEILESEEEEDKIEVEENTSNIIDIVDDSKETASQKVVVISDDNSDIEEIFEPVKKRKRKRDYDDYNIVDETKNVKKLNIIGIDQKNNDDIEIIKQKSINIPVSIKKELNNNVKIDIVDKKDDKKLVEVKIKDEKLNKKLKEKKTGSLMNNKKVSNNNIEINVCGDDCEIVEIKQELKGMNNNLKKEEKNIRIQRDIKKKNEDLKKEDNNVQQGFKENGKDIRGEDINNKEKQNLKKMDNNDNKGNVKLKKKVKDSKKDKSDLKMDDEVKKELKKMRRKTKNDDDDDVITKVNTEKNENIEDHDETLNNMKLKDNIIIEINQELDKKYIVKREKEEEKILNENNRKVKNNTGKSKILKEFSKENKNVGKKNDELETESIKKGKNIIKKSTLKKREKN